MVKIVIGQNRDRRVKAKDAFPTLADKDAFDALTAAQQRELIRRAVVFLLKRIFKGDVD